MAYQSGDLSNALQEGLAARRLADAGSRPFIDRQIGYALRAAGFADRARRYWWYDVDDTMWSLWNGRALSSNTIERLYRNPGVEWTNQMVTFALLKTLVSSHRSAEAVTLYHRRFSSPEEMLRYPSGHLGLLEDGATIALALQDTGERAEADRLLSLLPPSPGFAGSIPGISRRLHFFGTGRLQSGRLQSSSSLRRGNLGRFVGSLLGFGGCLFQSFRGPLLLQSSRPRFTLLPPCRHQCRVGLRNRFELVQGLLLGILGRCDTVLKRGGFERSQGLFL
jgi:hypothetical protein